MSQHAKNYCQLFFNNERSCQMEESCSQLYCGRSPTENNIISFVSVSNGTSVIMVLVKTIVTSVINLMAEYSAYLQSEAI